MNDLGYRLSGIVMLTGALTYAAVAQTPPKAQAPGVLPSGMGDAIDRDVARVRAATEKFKTTDAAEAAGYKRVTECVEYQPAGAMGYHFQNNTLLDTTLDLDHPEVLVYERNADGTFKLNGVEFLVPISAWTATDPPRIMGQALKRADKLGIWYLHVWTWTPSPSGIFADWNPLVKCATTSGGADTVATVPEPVPYPDGFRSWTHVKSIIIGPDHESFPKRGGIHHYYANGKAVAGYRTGSFPDGSVLVDEAVFTKDGEGRTKGLVFEGDRRGLDVMVKESTHYAGTGGWGYQHFDRDERTGRLSSSDQATCSTCHAKAAVDHVYSRIRS
jgi:hypothetical protein